VTVLGKGRDFFLEEKPHRKNGRLKILPDSPHGENGRLSFGSVTPREKKTAILTSAVSP
jgi:hypothetical protein